MLGALREDFTGCDGMNMFEDSGAIIAISARITDPSHNILQDDKTGSVFESFPLNALLEPCLHNTHTDSQSVFSQCWYE